MTVEAMGMEAPGAVVEDPAFDIRLEEPTPARREAVEDYGAELREAGDTFYTVGRRNPRDTPYGELMAAVRAEARGEGLPDGWVPATTFLMVCTEDGQTVVGTINVRHSIDNPYLRLCGGHIGYVVRPSARRRGYAHQALTLACRYARDELGLERVMLGCDQDNEASRRTIQSCGGVLDRAFALPEDDCVDPAEYGKLMYTWWVDTMRL